MTKIYNSCELIRWLINDGWFEVRVTGSHHHFKHDKKMGIVTVRIQKQIGKGLLNSILKQAKLKEE